MKANTVRYIAIALLIAVGLIALYATIAHADEKTVYPAVKNYLRARYGPGTEYEEVYRLYPGDGVKFVGIEGEWACIEVAGDFCYVSAFFLSDVDTTDAPWVATVQSNGRVKVRETPDGRTTGKFVKDGQAVRVYGISNGYGKIDAGWVSMDYLRLEDTANESFDLR